MVNTRVQLVWFKRDLRVVDHTPFSQAAERGVVLPLYVAEPDLWEQPDAAARHWAFIAESLLQLRQALEALGRPLVVRVGEITHVLHDLHQRFAIDAVWSHEETGNNWTFRRDERVRSFLHSRNIAWHELPQNGVVRRLASRDGWSRQWEARMAAPQAVAPEQLAPLAGIEAGIIPTAADIGLEPDPCPQRQRGGRDGGLERLKSFLTSRGEAYHAEMSSPVTAYESCSRLSPHLAYGTLSIREVVQANRKRRSEVKAQPAAVRGTWVKALAAFEGRLHWHCHFIQKLESEPRIEFENLQRACDNLREGEFDPEKFEAWSRAATGFPFVDACMRALEASGSINFRMRAMLNVLRQLPSLAALAATGGVSGMSFHGLRTGYPLRAVADAGGYDRYQHLPDLQPRQAVAGPGPVGSLYPAMDAGAGAGPGPLDSYTMGDGQGDTAQESLCHRRRLPGTSR